MAQVVVENVYKKYDKASDYAVDGISFTCEQGEFIALLGPSGCGKTTTLRMIAGLETLSDGEIRMDGEAMHMREPHKRGIGLAFEDYALYPPLNCYDNIAFNLRARKLRESEIKKRVLNIADMLHVTEILDRFPHHLSGGQKQRVNIARAIVREPRVLLLDEPMSHLDGKLRQVLRQEIRKLHKEIGCTTILVTHDQLEAMSLADRLVIMNEGRVQQYARPSEVYNKPHNEFVASFIGDPPMNIVDAVVAKNSKRCVFTFSDIRLAVPKDIVPNLHDKQRVRFGVRPDDVVISADGLPVRVSVFENLGEEKRMSIRLHDDSYFMISTLERVQYSAHAVIKVRLKEGKVHVFDVAKNE